MARKKKDSRKYKPRNEFRINNSPLAQGHPNYVFGETKSGKYKSLGLTTHPIGNVKHFELSKNPNPNDNDKSFLQLRVHTAKKQYYSAPLLNWKFAKEDMPIVRHRTKKYKKSTNRKSIRGNKNKK